MNRELTQKLGRDRTQKLGAWSNNSDLDLTRMTLIAAMVDIGTLLQWQPDNGGLRSPNA